MFGIWIALGALAVLTAACNANGESGGGRAAKFRDDLDRDEAFATLQQMIRDTAKAAGPDLRVNVAEGAEIGWTDCENRDAAHVFNTWSMEVILRPGQEPADLLPAVEAHWKSKGYDIQRAPKGDPHEDLIVRPDGYVLRALVVPDSAVLPITGDTPCVPKGDERSEALGPDNVTFEQTVARIKPLVEATARAARKGVASDFKTETILGECADPGDRALRYVVELPLVAGEQPADLLPAIEDYWTAQGFDIDRQNKKPNGQRDLYANLGDGSLRAVAIPGSGKLTVIGRGVCVPKPPDVPSGNP
ncbi:MAG TPA: hypothetical protein VJS45_00610 [Acidimicrobiia bacterium]|nr:hypothetical protein [Acidimicrobiia bacterium]